MSYSFADFNPLFLEFIFAKEIKTEMLALGNFLYVEVVAGLSAIVSHLGTLPV